MGRPKYEPLVNVKFFRDPHNLITKATFFAWLETLKERPIS
jgi:hypothetical protein